MKPPQLSASWHLALSSEWDKPYMEKLSQFLAKERQNHQVYPDKKDVFNALNLVDYEEVKVLIMGQDPYHGQGQAHGLSFSVPKGVRPPPSLKNIFKEMEDDIGVKPPPHGNLESWARQGVLLLNSVLTVRAGEPQSHAKKGWEEFTDSIVKRLVERDDPVIFVLWGKFAQDKCRHFLGDSTKRHFVLTAAHPSPYSATNGFFRSHHFSKINDLLTSQGKEPIDWKIDG